MREAYCITDTQFGSCELYICRISHVGHVYISFILCNAFYLEVNTPLASSFFCFVLFCFELCILLRYSFVTIFFAYISEEYAFSIVPTVQVTS
jgi:hypothetical protein